MIVDPFIVGFCGYIGHGKSHLAERLLEHYNPPPPIVAIRKAMTFGRWGPKCSIVPIGSTIREVARAILGEVPEKDEVYHVGNSVLTGRDILKYLASEVGRNLDQAVWISAMLRKARTCGSKIVLVDDVRFHEEASVCDMMISVFNHCAPILREDGHDSERYVNELMLASDARVEVSRGGYDPSFKDLTVMIDDTITAHRPSEKRVA